MNHVFYQQTGLHETKEELYGRLQEVLKENGIEYKKETVQINVAILMAELNDLSLKYLAKN